VWTSEEITQQLTLSETEVTSLFEAMNEVFHRHANDLYEVETYGHGAALVLLGSCESYVEPLLGCENALGFDRYPFADEWKRAAQQWTERPERLLQLGVKFSLRSRYQRWEKYAPWFLERINPLPLRRYTDDAHLPSVPRKVAIARMLEQESERMESRAKFAYCFKMYQSLATHLGEENWDKPFRMDQYGDYYMDSPLHADEINRWRETAYRAITHDDDFKVYFSYVHYQQRVLKQLEFNVLEASDYVRALQLGLLNEATWFDAVMVNEQGLLRHVTQQEMFDRQLPYQCEQLHPLVTRAVARIIEIELQRGEMTTEVTKLALAIRRVEGTKWFLKMLKVLGNEPLWRGSVYDYASNDTKQAVFSTLIKKCYPSADESLESFIEAVHAHNFPTDRLVSCAMYAPQWSEWIEQATGWDGLSSAVWFFHAHMKETFDKKSDAMIVRFSPYPLDELREGVFDRTWFFEVFNRLGEKRFATLHKHAKYTTQGSSALHRRAQLFADAARGVLDPATLEAEINDKRNQEKVRAYALLPVTVDDGATALHRYEFLQNFLKESKSFGAQRRQSEATTVRIALQNLATTLGFQDVDRMVWNLESEKLVRLQPMFEPLAIQDASVQITIEANGEPHLQIVKNEKVLKSVPRELKKHPAVVERLDVVKSFKAQRKRAVSLFENMMVTEKPLHGGELAKLLRNPIIGPIVAELVWTSEGAIGFPVWKDERLMLGDAEDTLHEIDAQSELFVAHPHHFLERGVWSAFQQHVFQNKRV
ncbi:MAG: DUF5724 domain-containing protein, partial [Bacilli bacterium]